MVFRKDEILKHQPCQSRHVNISCPGLYHHFAFDLDDGRVGGQTTLLESGFNYRFRAK